MPIRSEPVTPDPETPAMEIYPCLTVSMAFGLTEILRLFLLSAFGGTRLEPLRQYRKKLLGGLSTAQSRPAPVLENDEGGRAADHALGVVQIL